MTFAKPYFLFCLLKKVHSKACIFQQPEAKYFTLADERKAVFLPVLSPSASSPDFLNRCCEEGVGRRVLSDSLGTSRETIGSLSTGFDTTFRLL